MAWTHLILGLGQGASPIGPSSPNYPGALFDLTQKVKNLLDLTVDTPRGRLAYTNSPVTLYSSDETIRQFLNDGIAEIARRFYRIYGEHTITTTSRAPSFVDMGADTGARMWLVRWATWNGAELPRSSLTAIQQWNYGQMTLTGVPVCWYEDGPAQIGLFPPPAASGTLFVGGYEIPPLLVLPTDVTPLSPDLINLAVFYAAGKIAEKANDAPTIQARAPVWLKEYEGGCQRGIRRAWADDPDFARQYFEEPLPVGNPLEGAEVSMGAGQPQQP
jgi:hypothetical protein